MELAGDSDYTFSTGGVACAGNLSQIVEYTDDENTKHAIRISEYAYNSSDVVRDSKSHPHQGRIVTVFDRDVKVCSYQMVHMGRDQAPFWFNGWIVDDKKEPLEKQKIWEFEHYMLENTILDGGNPWDWIGGNRGCLYGREVVSFTDAEKRVFQDTIRTAMDLGSVRPGG